MSRGLSLYNKIVDSLSFSSELYKLRRELNARIDQPESVETGPRSHPLGVARWFKKRRISIAEAYLTVVRDLDSQHARSRLRALKIIIDASYHSQALDMPLNTARVQLALIKEAVKSRDDRRRQLELLQDFSASSYGQAEATRRFLDRLGLIELPEGDKKLKELGAGFDGHVHDAATSGRKNPTQLLIDAFIKGLSELTIAYNGAASRELMEEAVEAGHIVGIKVNIGIEFGLMSGGERFHFLALLPETRRAEDVRRFFEENERCLRPLFEGLEEDEEGRVAALKRLMKAFNEGPRKELNRDFPDKGAYRVKKLKMRGLKALVPLAGASRAHLAELLWRSYRRAMFNRVLYLKAGRAKALRDRELGLISDWDLRLVESRYSGAREEFRAMSPDGLRRRYFPEPAEAEHASAFDDLPKLRRLLSSAGLRLKLVRPLEHGYEKAARFLDGAWKILDEVEVYNVVDSATVEAADLLRFCRLVAETNKRRAEASLPPMLPVPGSDATGRSRELPGMGFIRSDFLKGRRGAHYAKRHIELPEEVSRLILSGGSEPDSGDRPRANGNRSQVSENRSPRILCMGKIAELPCNKIGDEEDGGAPSVPLGRAIRYLNPSIANLFFVAVGFAVAYCFIGAGYACLWLGITGFRNALADLFAFRGARIRKWNARSVNWNNIAQSLFWTGFSVPIMGFVKAKFDVLWPFGEVGFVYTAVKFFFISFANGLYIASHNKLRGFDRKVIRANLFRTIISWPFATVFAPLGNAMGIPSIVQSKIWSDVVAGFIEGGGKYFKTLRLRRRDVEEMVPRIIECKKEERAIAVLDLLYLFREEPRSRNSLKAALLSRPARRDRATGTRTKASGGLGPEALPALAAVFENEKLDRLLVDYSLTRHQKEMAVDLVRLITETLPEFRSWLAGLRRA
jgi:hypothetical protein